MFKIEYESSFPDWSANDIDWHRKLVGLSSSQFAINSTPWNYLNRRQKMLLRNDYSRGLFVVPKHATWRPFTDLSVDRFSLVLIPELEEMFFSEPQFSGMWEIVYANCVNAAQMVEILRAKPLSIGTDINLPYVVAIMRKVFDDMGQNKTEILSRNEIKR